MKNKYFYPIFKLKAKSWIRYWLLKKTEFKGKLSEILTGFSFNLQNTLRQKFVKFEIEGNSIQDGEPSPENEVPILSSGDNGSINEKIVNKNYLSFSETTKTQAGVTTDISETKMKFNGKMTSAYNIFDTIRQDKKIPAGTYKLSYSKLSGSKSGSGDYAIFFSFYRANGTRMVYTNFASNESGTSKTVTLSDDVAYYNYYAYGNSSSITFDNLELAFQLEQGSTASDIVPHEEQTYTIPTQQPMRSIGTVRDCFVKVNGTWYERHMPYIESYNGETLPQDVYNEIDGVKYCNEKSMSTTGQFSTGASVQYVDENNWNDLPCTHAQIDILENRPYTYEGQTNVYSTDVVVPYLEIQYWESDTNG